MAYGHRAVIKTQKHSVNSRPLQAVSSSGALLGGCHPTQRRTDTLMAEAHVSEASCQHKPAGVFGVTKSELPPCKQAICTGFSHKKVLDKREALTLPIPRLLLASSWVTRGHLLLRINQHRTYLSQSDTANKTRPVCSNISGFWRWHKCKYWQQLKAGNCGRRCAQRSCISSGRKFSPCPHPSAQSMQGLVSCTR